jgi:serine/threonine-protein kinase
MDPERWARVKDLFSSVLERPDEEREALLNAAAEEDPSLALRVRSLLRAHEAAGTSFLEADALDLARRVADEVTSNLLGQRIGAWEVLSEIGRGGMGEVFLARRADGAYEQQAALKVLKRGMDTDEIVRRFLRERRILSELVHENVARLLDGGSTADGRPYFVLEHIAGKPIDEWAAEAVLPVEERLRLFLRVASAVDFAHQHLIVHRDLKPANILVGPDGVPKLLDFGIAKLLDPEQHVATALEVRAMTPEYASPEQLAGAPVTTATDVYGLGLLLYELLAGASPAPAERAGGVRSPSEFVRRAAAGDSGQLRLARRLAGDLDAIVLTALEAEPQRRYGSVAAFAADVERHLERLPISARRPTWGYRMGRFLRRHRLASAAAAGLVLATGVATFSALEVRRQRDEARTERARSQALSSFLIDLFRVSDPDESAGAKVTARELLDAAAQRLSDGESGQLGAEPESRSDLLQAIGVVYGRLGLEDEAKAVLERVRALRADPLGSEAELARAETLHALGDVERAQGAHAASESLYREALDTRRRWLGPEHPAVAETLNGLGLLEAAQGRPDEARRLLEEAARIRRAAGGALRPALAETLGNLASIAIDQIRPEEAAARIAEVQALHRELGGAGPPQTARLLSALAGLLFRTGDYEGSEARFVEVLELRRRLLPAGHPDLAVTLTNLSTVQLERFRLVEAEAALREALAIHRGRHGETPHPDVAHTLNNLASVVRERGDSAQAEGLYREALALYWALYGDRHGTVGNALANLALARRDRGDLAGAEAQALESLAIRVAVQGPESAAAAASQLVLASIRQQLGRWGEAEADFRQGLALREKKFEANHPAVASALVGLAGLLLETDRAGEAEPLAARAVAIRKSKLSLEHPAVAAAENLLGATWAALGRTEEARPLLAASLARLRTTRGPDHPESVLAARRWSELSPHSARP